MDSQPKAPPKIHVKNGTVITNRQLSGEKLRVEDFDAQIDERTGGTVDAGCIGRRWMAGGAERRRDGIGLVSRLSSHAADPLNWSQTRKELAFFSLLLSIACFAALKTTLVTVTSVVATQLSVSYSATTALTGVPLIIGAFTGLGSQILAQTIGKRGILLGSAVLVLAAALWNMHLGGSYAQFMVSRILQGMGWGAFEGLVGGSIDDVFLVHEQKARRVTYNTVSIIFTWGSPILGGFVSQQEEGFSNQIMIINIIQAFSILFLIFGMPETTYKRSSNSKDDVASAPLGSGFKAYAQTLRLTTPNSTAPFSISLALRPFKALVAPSALLTTLLTSPLLGTALATAHSLSLLFSAMPTFLFPSRLGYILILPLVFSLLLYSISAVISHHRSQPPRHLSSGRGELGFAVVGMLVGITGLLGWGLYTVRELMPGEYENDGSAFSLDVTGLDLSLRAVSALFGLLVAGAVTLSLSGNSNLSSSTSRNSSSRNPWVGSEIASAHRTLEEILVGVWVVGMPMWIESDAAGTIPGLQSTVIALAVVALVFGSSVGAMLWVRGESLREVDERVLGRRIEDDEGVLKRWETED